MIRLPAEAAGVVAMQNWTLLVTDDSEFVICDRALTMYDAQPRFPWTGNAWDSSRYAQAALPLAPTACLLMTPGSEQFTVRQVTEGEVEAINVRSYGWAQESLFASSAKTLEAVRDVARANPSRVPKPRLPSTVITTPFDEEDDQAGADHVERGWPRCLTVPRPDGTVEHLSYELVEIDPDADSIPLVRPVVAEALKAAFKALS